MKKLIIILVLLTTSLSAFAVPYAETIKTFLNKGNFIYFTGSMIGYDERYECFLSIPKSEINTMCSASISEDGKNYKKLSILMFNHNRTISLPDNLIKSLTQDSLGNIAIEILPYTEETEDEDDIEDVYDSLFGDFIY